MPTETAFSIIISKSSSLFLAESFLLSLTPNILQPTGKITQAVTTGPAKGPLPTSSIPPIYSIP